MWLGYYCLILSRGSYFCTEHKFCDILSQVTPLIIHAFAGSVNCSRAFRPAVELIHISKSGGTSMCQLAAKSGLWNPGADMNANCLVSLETILSKAGNLGLL